jgi:hypothetical protein
MRRRSAETGKDNAETLRRRDAERGSFSAPPRLGNSAFKETEIGLIPVDWEMEIYQATGSNRFVPV